MNRQTADARWTQLRGLARERWGHLTGNPHQVVAGHFEQTVGRIAAAHARANQIAERELKSWRRRHSAFLEEHSRAAGSNRYRYQ